MAGIEFKTTIVTVSNAKRLLQALLMVLGVIYLVQLSKVKRRDSGLSGRKGSVMDELGMWGRGYAGFGPRVSPIGLCKCLGGDEMGLCPFFWIDLPTNALPWTDQACPLVLSLHTRTFITREKDVLHTLGITNRILTLSVQECASADLMGMLPYRRA